MKKRDAISFLMEKGWNYDGAEAIVDALEDADMLDMNEEKLEMVSEDYTSR